MRFSDLRTVCSTELGVEVELADLAGQAVSFSATAGLGSLFHTSTSVSADEDGHDGRCVDGWVG